MIVHVMGLDKFIQPFIDFNSKYIDKNLEHKYFVIHKTTQYELKKNQKNVYEITGYFKNVFNLFFSFLIIYIFLNTTQQFSQSHYQSSHQLSNQVHSQVLLHL